MATRESARMFDLRTHHRHLRSGRTTEEAHAQYLESLPDAADNIRDPEDGGEEDGFDRRYGLAPEPEPEPAPAPMAAPEIPRIPEIPPIQAPPMAPQPLDPLAHLDTSNERLAALENNPMMPPPQPIPDVPLPPVSRSSNRDDDEEKS